MCRFAAGDRAERREGGVNNRAEEHDQGLGLRDDVLMPSDRPSPSPRCQLGTDAPCWGSCHCSCGRVSGVVALWLSR